MKRVSLPVRHFAARILASAIAAALALAVQAAEVTGEMAMAAAAAWTAENPALAQDIGVPVAVQARHEDGGRLLWYEVAMSGGGGVVVAADTEIEPIVAVIGEYAGAIPQGHPLEAMLLADMGRRLDVLGGKVAVKKALAAANDDEVRISAANAARKWDKLVKGNAAAPIVKNLAKASNAITPNTVIKYIPEWASKRLTYWSQFSTYTPNNYPAGCVATAGVALLQFFNVTHAPKTTNTCSVDGASTSLTTKGIDYDWSMMPESNASYGSFTPTQKDIADRAVYDMGVCLGNSYKSDGSSASISTLAQVLRTQYGFADARYVYSISAAQYDQLIYAQVRAGSPVVMSIQSKNSGHAVLAVGYGEDADRTAYTRVFMGWGGSSDAWYALPNVTDFNSLSAVVTMIGATSDTLALCGRITTESGKPAAYADVNAGGKTAMTDENGYWGVRISPSASVVACSCGGNAATAAIGAQAAKIGSCSASQLAAALPGEIDFTIPDADALTVYTSPAEAVRAALRENKILMVLVGYDGCGYCAKLKTQIKGMGSAFSDDFVLFYANTDLNAYGLDDETYTGSPYWGTFDPRVWQVERRWAADNGRFTVSRGYSASDTTSALQSARKQWARLNAAPASFDIAMPGQISMPTSMSAKLSFADGTVTRVSDGLVWSVVSGTAATIIGGNVLSPVQGASGEVTLRCEGYFWNTLYTATKTIKVLNGVVAEKLEIEGPATIDLLTTDSAQFSAQAILSDGSRVEVPAEWTTVELKSTNHVVSASGRITFTKNRYSQASTITVKARYGNCSASTELAVWGSSVKVAKYTLSDNCAWPGKTVTLTIDQVQWWRHGGWEEPTDDFTGVGVHWYYFVGNVNCYQTRTIGTSRTISFTVPADRNDGSKDIEIHLRTSGLSVDDFGLTWMTARLQYVPSVPSQLVNVEFVAPGGEPSTQTMRYAVGYPYAVLPKTSKTGYYYRWYTAEQDGEYITESSNCVASVTRLYARWTPNYYRISYNANGGTGSMYDSWPDYDSPYRLRANTFTKPGAMFAGWATTPYGPVVYRDGEEVLNLFSEYAVLTLYAVWVENGYQVNFDANGGTGDMAPQMLVVGACAPLKPAKFTRRGATFAGWALTPGGHVAYADGAEVCNLATACGATVTLYAVWQLPAVATIDLSGPDVIDLYDDVSVQFKAVCRLKDGTVADVAPVWRIEETAVTNAVISADGLVTFPTPSKYNKASRLKVTVECNGVSESKEVDVWGWYVSVSACWLSQRVAWPGQTITMVPQAVTWWRHGITEEPTSNFEGIDFKATYSYINNTTYLSSQYAISGADGLAFQIPSSVSEKEGYGYIFISATASRHGIDISRSSASAQYFKYLPSAPTKLVEVTFVADGGIPASQTSKYAVGYTYGEFPPVARTGYRANWYTAKEGGTYLSTSSNCVASVTRLYARWTPNYYKIVYNANGGTGSMYDSWFYYDKPANLRRNAFTNNGLVFAGWATSPTGPVVYADGEEILNLSSVYAEIKLYAVWRPERCTVNFDANGGTIPETMRTIAYGAAVGQLPTPVRSGYSFNGWYTAETGGTKISTSTVVTADVTYYAHWTDNKYKVTLDGQGATSMGTTSIKVAYGEALPQIEVPTKTGYTFGGYFTEPNGKGVKYYYSSGRGAVKWDKLKGATLYARWTTAKYTVTLNGQGATTAGTASVKVAFGNALPQIEVPIKTGYAFGGYFAEPNGKGTKYYYSSGKGAVKWDKTENTTLYAKWAPIKYKITFNRQGATVKGTDSVTAIYGEALPQIEVPTKTGYVFGGYFTEPNGKGTKYYYSSGKGAVKWDKLKGATLYARWTKAKTVAKLAAKLGNTATQDEAADEPVFKIEEGVLLAVEPNGLTEIEVPDTVVVIGEAAFVGATEVRRVVLPETVTAIGEFAFFGCAALEELVLLTGELEVSDTAFLGCSSLADEDGTIVIEGIPFDCIGPDTNY